MNTQLPMWVDAVTAVLVVLGAFATLVGASGLLRLENFYQRLHAPTLGATVGVWCVVSATVLQFSFLEGRLSGSAILVGGLLVLTAPITTIFLARAALFRDRLAGRAVPPSLSLEVKVNPESGAAPSVL